MTHVFLYAAGASHPFREPCQRVLHRCVEGVLGATTNVEVVQEILYVLHRRGRTEDARALSRHILDLFPDMLPVTPTDMSLVCALLERYPNLPVRDAVHAATMRNNGVETVISADRHFDLVRELHRIDPARPEGLY